MATVLSAFTVLATVYCFVNGLGSTAFNITTEHPSESACITFNGVNGDCKTLHECPVMQQLLDKMIKTPRDINILDKAECGDGTTVRVCCPNNCYTPDGREGNCVGIRYCLPLAKLLQGTTNDRNLQYVQDSRCESSEKYSVCCPLEYPSLQKENCDATVSAFPPDPRTECCGVDNTFGNKIIGGVVTKVDEYPWLVLIEYMQRDAIGVLCGGTLISGRYVLTSAHCVTGRILKYGTPTNVRLGEYDTDQEGPDCAEVDGGGTDCTDGMITIPIERTIPHPDYRASVKHSPNDIALIRLQRNAPFTAFIRPICLPSKDLTASASSLTNLTAAGWGTTSSNKSSNVKLQVDLHFVGRDLCDPVYKLIDININKSIHFCAEGEPGKDTCMGDSGGPLMFENGFTYEAIGIVSFGPTQCGLPGVPSVYTGVYQYLAWIKGTIVK